MRRRFLLSAIVLLVVLFAGADAAYADRLEFGPEATAWKRIGALLILYLHILGGAVGLVAGSVASLTRKGGAGHRVAGRVFLVAMFITYLIGAGVAPFLTDGQRPNFVAGVLALYLLVTGVAAARRRRFRAGWAEVAGLPIALAITGMGVLFMVMGANDESGTVDGSPPEAFVVFVIAGVAASAGEVNVLRRRTLSGAARMTRHLWRMCASFFFASGSLFLGQPRVFPEWFNASPLPVLLAFVPILVMVGSILQLKRARGSQVRA